MTEWRLGELASPVTGRPLAADASHSLSADGERWPVVDGIPFLRADRRALADLALAALDAGRREDALAALLADQDNWARTPPPGEAACRALVRDAAGLSFREAMERLAFGPVAAYFAHRWSDPTFLSGLALAEAHWTSPRRVFELACGAGHFLREFGRMSAEVSGADIVFAKLWLARRYVSPDARLVCFDAALPWPLADGAADLVFCHDAFYFLEPKPAILARLREHVAPDGGVLAISHVHNRDWPNLSSGAAVTAAVRVSEEAEEGMRAFLEKRPPRWAIEEGPR